MGREGGLKTKTKFLIGGKWLQNSLFKRLGKPSIVKKKIFCEIISLTGGGGGLTDFIPLFYFSKHPSNTLQTHCNTLQTPLKHPSTPFKQHSKSSLFFAQKVDGKKINRDFIKGGRGGGSPFYEVISQKIFFFSQLMASLRLPLIP